MEGVRVLDLMKGGDVVRMYLLRYFFEACFCYGEKWTYFAVRVHASSIADCLFYGKMLYSSVYMDFIFLFK